MAKLANTGDVNAENQQMLLSTRRMASWWELQISPGPAQMNVTFSHSSLGRAKVLIWQFMPILVTTKDYRIIYNTNYIKVNIRRNQRMENKSRRTVKPERCSELVKVYAAMDWTGEGPNPRGYWLGKAKRETGSQWASLVLLPAPTRMRTSNRKTATQMAGGKGEEQVGDRNYPSTRLRWTRLFKIFQIYFTLH